MSFDYSAQDVAPQRVLAGRCASFLFLTAIHLLAPDLAFGVQESGVLSSDRLSHDGRITIGETATFFSNTYGEDRTILVYLPDAYSRSQLRYPVIYLRDELIPYMAERYRTEPFNILVGHSLGGLFTVHSLVNHPSLFDAHIAASPALYWNGGSEVDRAREVFGSGQSMKNFLYMTYSGGDGENIRASTDAVASILEESSTPDLEWRFTFLPDDRHNSSPMKSILGGLELLFTGWAYRGGNSAEALAEHYRALTTRFGFECRPSKGAVASRARTLVRQGNLRAAIEIYQYNATLYPDAPDVYEALGRTYVMAGKTEKAIEAYERSLELDPENSSVLEILRQLKEGRGSR